MDIEVPKDEDEVGDVDVQGESSLTRGRASRNMEKSSPDRERGVRDTHSLTPVINTVVIFSYSARPS